MREIEIKFRVSDEVQLRARLDVLGASQQGGEERHEDTYYRHPCRDFRETGEALRIRRVDGEPHVTYKGPREHAQSEGLKVRRELEWALGPGDGDGSKMRQLLEGLGFAEVATVRKTRRSFQLVPDTRPMTVTIDKVEGLGVFAEVEILVANEESVDQASAAVRGLAVELGLQEAQTSSYLGLVLAQRAGAN